MKRVPPLIVGCVLLVGACSAATSPDSGDGQPSAAGSETAALLEHELVDVRSGERFTLGALAADKPVLLETMAVWCTTCLSQLREVVRAHALADFHSVGIDVDPNGEPEQLAEYAQREGFDWRFAVADASLVQLLIDAYGFAATLPPSTPTFVIHADGEVRALEFGRVRSAEELIAELDSSTRPGTSP